MATKCIAALNARRIHFKKKWRKKYAGEKKNYDALIEYSEVALTAVCCFKGCEKWATRGWEGPHRVAVCLLAVGVHCVSVSVCVCVFVCVRVYVWCAAWTESSQCERLSRSARCAAPRPSATWSSAEQSALSWDLWWKCDASNREGKTKNSVEGKTGWILPGQDLDLLNYTAVFSFNYLVWLSVAILHKNNQSTWEAFF